MGQVLLLNADAQPVSYLPLSAIQWKEAITYLWLDKVTVLEWYDNWMVRSASWETKMPAVMMLKQMQRRRQRPRFSKNNLYLRDMYTCLYCEKQHPKHQLTMDHVVPISKGGKTNWTNIATSCGDCNSRKANKTFGWKPLYKPYQPGYWELVRKRKQLPFAMKHPSWEKWLNY